MLVDVPTLLRERQARLLAMTPEQRRAYQNQFNGNGETVPPPRPSYVRVVKARPAPKAEPPPKVAVPEKVPRGRTDVDRLMEVARKIGPEFTFADLVVSAWKEHPGHFGLAGYAYPNSHKVACMLSHRGGPVKQGRLRRIGPNRFRVTGVVR